MQKAANNLLLHQERAYKIWYELYKIYRSSNSKSFLALIKYNQLMFDYFQSLEKSDEKSFSLEISKYTNKSFEKNLRPDAVDILVKIFFQLNDFEFIAKTYEFLRKYNVIFALSFVKTSFLSLFSIKRSFKNKESLLQMISSMCDDFNYKTREKFFFHSFFN